MTDFRVVYVVNWACDVGVGGFEWRIDRTEAEAFLADLKDPTARIHTVHVPSNLDGWGISNLLDDDGWSDGGDPR